ncbi:MAG: aspartate 4-decarboxylase, partial [Muribaculaceae bacterium]|nr:aspartate 4-decarboxylase [Muribaculaceae bacterium]
AEWLRKTHNPLDVTLRLAAEKGIVVLNGSGFAGPNWSIRTSEANLNRDDYATIGRQVRAILEEYYKEYSESK